MELDPVDPVDVDHIEQVLQTRGYQLIRTQLEREAANFIKDLCVDRPEAETVKLRGRLAGVRRALAIPAELIAKAKKR